jgi:hypothetical protein
MNEHIKKAHATVLGMKTVTNNLYVNHKAQIVLAMHRCKKDNRR